MIRQVPRDQFRSAILTFDLDAFMKAVNERYSYKGPAYSSGIGNRMVSAFQTWTAILATAVRSKFYLKSSLPHLITCAGRILKMKIGKKLKTDATNLSSPGCKSINPICDCNYYSLSQLPISILLPIYDPKWIIGFHLVDVQISF